MVMGCQTLYHGSRQNMVARSPEVGHYALSMVCSSPNLRRVQAFIARSVNPSPLGDQPLSIDALWPPAVLRPPNERQWLATSRSRCSEGLTGVYHNEKNACV